jgi:hypothetical protein
VPVVEAGIDGLEWEDPDNVPGVVDSYRVYLKDQPNIVPDGASFVAEVAAPTKTWTIEGDPGTKYAAVTAYDADGPDESGPSNEIEFAIQAASQIDVPVSGEGVGVCSLSYSPASLSFGSVEVGNAAQMSVTLQNDGTGDCTITSISIPAGAFSVVSPPTLPLTLIPTGTQSVTVQFAPTVMGSDSATLSIVY